MSVTETLCAVKGYDQALYVNQFDGNNWSGFQSLGGEIVTTPSCASLNITKTLCAVEGSDYALYVNQFN